MRSILITGGNGGLGLAIARCFLAQDSETRVWLGVRSNRARAEELAAEFSGRCLPVDLEVTSAEAWQSAVGKILETDGRVDVLVNNAGMHRDHLLATMPDEAWHSVISANLDAVFLGCRAVIPTMMRQRFGRIVNISSLSAVLPPLGQTNYAAAKAGVVALSQTLAKETARSGITVNSVLPGYIDTEALGGMDAEARKNAQRGIPMRRFGRPEEVAAAVCFLAGKDAGYITGAALKIDGGIF
ncbi:SDR family oxidoreductase [Luteolibacter yonseiensis]|uniref:SDR family oxidoreductase n=1 Tax=Luteolibacter yonseiensis TaxID=1144680 RepID=A0A934V7I4_9BACT|nr:SDR family NAD(P)-dependent oxidoreductase [Luteolibacter yonseiensis]MBK1816172.1 SDR family oxidoreductase [Luteolibacter yonseiensis]